MITHVDVSLSCGHTVSYPVPTPYMGDQVFCYRCDAWFEVIGGGVPPIDITWDQKSGNHRDRRKLARSTG